MHALSFVKENDIYQPLNHYALIEVLSPYIYQHDMMILASLSNKIRKCIHLFWNKILHNVTNQEYIIDVVNHQCYHCFKRNYIYNNEILLTIYKNGSKKILKIYKFKNKSIDVKILHDCVDMATRHDYYFLEKITKYNIIINPNTLSLICGHCNEKIINQILNFYMYNMPTLALFKILLPQLCLYSKRHIIFKWIDLLTFKECDLLYTLFKQSTDIDIQNLLLLHYIKLSSVNNECIEWFSRHGNLSAIKYLKECKLFVDQNLLLTEKYYEHYLHANLTYLNDTLEYNILSVKLADKYHRTTVYIDKLDNESIFNLLSVNNNYIVNELMNKIQDLPLTLNQMDILYEKMNGIMSKTLVLKLFRLTHLSIDIKIKMLPFLYKHNGGIYATFLGANREYNLLSLSMVDINPEAYIYVNHLNLTDKLSLINKYQHHYSIVRVLIHHIKIYEIKIIQKTNYRIYKVIKDNQIEYYRISPTFNVNHCKWLLKHDLLNYKELVHYVYKDVKKCFDVVKNDMNKNYLFSLMDFIVTHDEFKNIDSYTLLMLLKFYSNNKNVVMEMIKHPFFNLSK